MKSLKETQLDTQILKIVPESINNTVQILLNDAEIHSLQEYANTVSIKRLRYTDHGPVHMRKVVRNAIKMAYLLQEAQIPMSLETEGTGSFEDSTFVLCVAGMLHDIGMSITRQDHENYSAIIAYPIIDRILQHYCPHEISKRVMLRSIILEAIVGHMAIIPIHSLEAGLILAADGCDMEKGRARIPMLLHKDGKVGDIHKYSSTAIEQIHIKKGKQKPICILVEMSESVGFFQIEEVLFPKLAMSPAKPYIELQAHVIGGKHVSYL